MTTDARPGVHITAAAADRYAAARQAAAFWADGTSLDADAAMHRICDLLGIGVTRTAWGEQGKAEAGEGA